MLEPINNQRYAFLAGARYDTRFSGYGKGIIYGITHLIEHHFCEIAGYRNPCVLVTSFSDGSVTERIAAKLPGNVIRWFSNNVGVQDSRIEAIPIGFVYNWERTNILMKTVELGPKTERSNLMYMNFLRNIPRTPNPRLGLYELFGRHSWVTTKGGEPFSNVPAQEFYDDIRSHHYVLSPPGAGKDCHRSWEAMALGSIPIVLRSIETEILSDMPCLRVDNWDEVTESHLMNKLPQLQSRFSSDAMKKLDMCYWRNRIQGVLQGALL